MTDGGEKVSFDPIGVFRPFLGFLQEADKILIFINQLILPNQISVSNSAVLYRNME